MYTINIGVPYHLTPVPAGPIEIMPDGNSRYQLHRQVGVHCQAVKTTVEMVTDSNYHITKID